MPTRLTRTFEVDPTAAQVDPDLKAYVALAAEITRCPVSVRREVLRAAVSTARSPREYLDAVGVMFAFNFVTRVANALGVVPEIPGWMRRVEPLRRLGLRIMALGFRTFVDLRPRRIPGPTAGEHFEGIRRLFADLGLGQPPRWLQDSHDSPPALAHAPPVLATVRECLEALVRRGEVDPAVTVQFMAIGRVALEAVPQAVELSSLASCWHAGRDPKPTDTSDARDVPDLVLEFARDVSYRSDTITQGRIDALRRAGLDDAAILDVTVAAALWSALGRLEVLVANIRTGGESSSVVQTDSDIVSRGGRLSETSS